MKKIRIVLFVIAAAIVIAAMGKFLAEKRLPPGRVYKGKTVSQWVSLCVEQPVDSFSGDEEPGMKEIHDLGSEAVPYLIEEITRKPGFTTRSKYARIHANLPALISRKLPKPNNASTRAFRAFCALSEMGPSARAAVPFLISQFKASNAWIGFDEFALVSLGTNANDAIPALTNALHSQDLRLSAEAARALAVLDPGYPDLEPILLKRMKSTNIVERQWACRALGEFKQRPPNLTAALHEALNDADPVVKQHALDALKREKGSP